MNSILSASDIAEILSLLVSVSAQGKSKLKEGDVNQLAPKRADAIDKTAAKVDCIRAVGSMLWLILSFEDRNLEEMRSQNAKIDRYLVKDTNYLRHASHKLRASRPCRQKTLALRDIKRYILPTATQILPIGKR